MRKLTMPSRAADAGKLCACLIGLAAVPAWALAQAPPAKPEPAKSPSITADLKWVDVSPKSAEDAETQAIQEQIKALTAKLEMLRQQRQQAAVARHPAIEIEAARANAEWAQSRKNLSAAEKQVFAAQLAEALAKAKAAGGPQKLVAGQNGVKVIGPDGKEMPGVIVVIEPPSGAGAKAPAPATAEGKRNVLILLDSATGKVQEVNPAAVRSIAPAGPIALSRATYTLPKEQVAALATLLNGLKHTVMETKAENDTLVVTTTPEAQATVQRFVWMLAGDKTYGYQTGEGGRRIFLREGPDGGPVRINLTAPAKPGTADLDKGLGGLRLYFDQEAKPKPADVRNTEAKPEATKAPAKTP